MSTFAFHTADCTYEGAPPPPAKPRAFPIFIQLLCNNTKTNNQHNNNSKQLTIAGGDRVGIFKNKKTRPRGKVPGGIFRKASQTHLTHTAAPTMSGFNTIYEKEFEKHKKDSSWGILRLASVTCEDISSDNNRKGKRGRVYPQPSFTPRRITGSTDFGLHRFRRTSVYL